MKLFYVMLSLAIAWQTSAHAKSNRKYISLRSVNFGRVIWDDYVDKCPEKMIEVNDLEVGDVTGDGREDALVIGSSCVGDASGPDIHRAYTLTLENQLAELPFEKRPAFNDIIFKNELLGRTNYKYQVKDGFVIENYQDASGRSIALRIWYKWDGKKFAVANAWRGRLFDVKLNCAKTAKDVDRAVCRIEAIATLHNRLDEKIAHLNSQLKRRQRKEFKKEQIAWYRTRETECPLTAAFTECLSSHYLGRINDLNQRITGSNLADVKLGQEPQKRSPASKKKKKKRKKPKGS